MTTSQQHACLGLRVRVPLAFLYGIYKYYNNLIIYCRRKRVAADGHRDGTTPDSDLAGQSKDDIIFAVQSVRLFNNHYITIIFNSTRSMRRKLERNRRH